MLPLKDGVGNKGNGLEGRASKEREHLYLNGIYDKC